MFFGISSVAPEIVGIFLGEKWVKAVLPIQVLSLVVPLRLLNTVLPSALYAIGRAEVSVSNNFIACVLMPVSFAIGAHWGLQGVCLAWVCGYPLYVALSLFRALPVIGVTVMDYLRAVRGPAVAALIMYAAVYLLRRLLAGIDLSAPIILCALVLPGCAVYAALALVLERQACVDLASLAWSEQAGERVAALEPFGSRSAGKAPQSRDEARSRDA